MQHGDMERKSVTSVQLQLIASLPTNTVAHSTCAAPWDVSLCTVCSAQWYIWNAQCISFPWDHHSLGWASRGPGEPCTKTTTCIAARGSRPTSPLSFQTFKPPTLLPPPSFQTPSPLKTLSLSLSICHSLLLSGVSPGGLRGGLQGGSLEALERPGPRYVRVNRTPNTTTCMGVNLAHTNTTTV